MRLETFDWIFNYPIDFEHKKYILLSFIEDIKADLINNKLYPSITQVEYQLSNLNKWKTTRELYVKKDIKGIDFKNLTLIYDESEDTEDMNQINQIVDYSLEHLNIIYKQLRTKYLEIEKTIDIKYIGIVPLYKKEGYIIFKEDLIYKLYKFDRWLENKVSFVKDYEVLPFNSPESIKSDMIWSGEISNPLMIYISNEDNYIIDGCLLEIFNKSFLDKI